MATPREHAAGLQTSRPEAASRTGHDHDHHHHHGEHHHHHDPADLTGAFLWGAGLNVAFVAAEMVAGILTHSMALVADAAHNLSDVLGLLMAGTAVMLARRSPSLRRSYGLRRGTILAALANAALLLVTIAVVAVEAVRRLADPSPVAAQIVIWVALAGVAINTATALLFFRRQGSDINVRGAFVHMAADAAVSAGVVLTALGISVTRWTWIDPVTSLVIVGVIAIGTWPLLRDSLDLALDATPRTVDPAAVRTFLSDLPGIMSVDDLHIWALSTTETALTAHLRRGPMDDIDGLLKSANAGLASRFGIAHATLQIETGDGVPCRLLAADAA